MEELMFDIKSIIALRLISQFIMLFLEETYHTHLCVTPH
jgi:hypothetical protein